MQAGGNRINTDSLSFEKGAFTLRDEQRTDTIEAVIPYSWYNQCRNTLWAAECEHIDDLE